MVRTISLGSWHVGNTAIIREFGVVPSCDEKKSIVWIDSCAHRSVNVLGHFSHLYREFS